MASEKRPASDDFGSSQMVVKRQNLGNNSKAVAISNGSGSNGALIQAVCYSYIGLTETIAEVFERIQF